MTCGCVQVTATTEPLENLLRWIVVSVPQVPYELALDYLRQAYIEFARKTSLVQHKVTLPIQKGVTNYALEGIDGYEVFAVKDVSYMDFPYQRFADANNWYYAWGYRFRLDGNREIVFHDEPSQDDSSHVLVLHLIPNDCVDTIYTEISTPFGKGIAMGALADLLEIPNKAWTNMSLAANKRQMFNRTVLSGRQLEITNRGARTPQFRPVRVL